MSETETVWHPFPEEKPKNRDFYKNNVIAWADINEEYQTVWLTYGE